MAKAKAAVAVGDLVKSALLKLAESPDGMKLTGKDGLFSSAKGANAEAIAECQNAEKPLLAVRKEGKAELATLTPTGFERIAVDLPEDRVGVLAKTVALTVPLAERASFLQAVISRSPVAAAELTPVLEEVIAAEKREQEQRVAAAAKRKEAEEASRKALERAIQLLEDRRRSRIAALRRELEAEGESAEELVIPGRVEPPARAKEIPAPTTADENDFRRDVARQLAASWRATWEMNKPEVRDFLESAMWNIRGLRLVGEVGERIAYSGKLHESAPGVFSGDTVRITRPGWVLDEDAGEFVVLKALVEK